ncbi:MAG: hypothetical protein AB1758_28840 [Candidatus Eremiobacterota bacterium]
MSMFGKGGVSGRAVERLVEPEKARILDVEVTDSPEYLQIRLSILAPGPMSPDVRGRLRNLLSEGLARPVRLELLVYRGQFEVESPPPEPPLPTPTPEATER